MSVIQGTGTSMYLAAHMKEQAKSMSIIDNYTNKASQGFFPVSM